MLYSDGACKRMMGVFYSSLDRPSNRGMRGSVRTVIDVRQGEVIETR